MWCDRRQQLIKKIRVGAAKEEGYPPMELILNDQRQLIQISKLGQKYANNSPMKGQNKR